MSGGILARPRGILLARAAAGTGDARGHRDSVRRVLALVGGRAQPDVLLRVRSDLALDLGHLHSLVVARIFIKQDLRELLVVDVAVAVLRHSRDFYVYIVSSWRV